MTGSSHGNYNNTITQYSSYAKLKADLNAGKLADGHYSIDGTVYGVKSNRFIGSGNFNTIADIPSDQGIYQVGDRIFSKNRRINKHTLSFITKPTPASFTVISPITTLISGAKYIIVSPGNTNFTTYSAADSNAGTTFTSNTSGAITGTGTVALATTGQTRMAISAPAPFYAVRIGVVHGGGSSKTVNTCVCVAETDDIGSLDYTVLTDANLKKFITPKKAGASYNTLVTDGSIGWKTCKFSGADTVSIADPGAGKWSVTWSDMVYVNSTPDENGIHNLLINYDYGVGSSTYNSNVTGESIGTRSRDYRVNKRVALYRATAALWNGSAIDPTTWSDANTPSIANISPPILVEFFSAYANQVNTVQFVGDSRMAVSSELSATAAFASTEQLYLNAALNAGIPTTVLHQSQSGATSAQYQPQGLISLANGVYPDYAIYNVYTVNDGVITDGVAALAMGRAAEFVNYCYSNNVIPILVHAWPKSGTTYTGAELSNLARIKTFCTTLATTLSPLELYGNADGTWNATYGFDSNHGNQVCYSDFAQRLLAVTP